MTDSSRGSRFIPREEIQAVSAWRFSAVDGSDERALPEPAEPDAAPALTTEALEQAVAEARQQAYAEGFSHGHDAGGQAVRDALEATARQSAEETAVRMAQLLNDARDHLRHSEEQISRHILDLACDLARQVLRQELRVHTDHLQPVIREALGQLVEDGLPATVRLNPADLALMKDALQDALGTGTPAPELVADPAISAGGCRVESASTAVDATIEKRWSRAIANLGLETAWAPENADV